MQIKNIEYKNDCVILEKDNGQYFIPLNDIKYCPVQWNDINRISYIVYDHALTPRYSTIFPDKTAKNIEKLKLEYTYIKQPDSFDKRKIRFKNVPKQYEIKYDNDTLDIYCYTDMYNVSVLVHVDQYEFILKCCNKLDECNNQLKIFQEKLLNIKNKNITDIR